jgi:hypothetical protein
MGWTIVQPNPEHIKARKEVHHGIESSNFAFAQVNTAVKQPLQDEDLLTLPKLFSFLQEVERDGDNAFLMRGNPVNQNPDLSYGLTESNWIDCSSRQFQLDLDNETELLNQGSPLDDRVAVAMEDLPFLKNCRFIAQLSSSAGLGIVYKKNGEEKDCSKKYCLRLWVETDKAYSCLELYHHLADFSSIIDLSMYEPTRRHYIMRGHFLGTENLLKNEPHLKYYEGVALSLDEIPGEIKEAARKKTKTSLKKITTALDKTGKAWKTLYNTNRQYLVHELEKDAENGELANIRNPIFSELFRREALFSSGNCALLIDEMLNAPALMGDRDEKNLKDWAKLSGKKALSILKLEAETFRHNNFHSIENFEAIDLDKRDWSNLLDYRAVAIRSCMGTNKTKGVIYNLVKEAKASNKTVLIVTPLIAVTLQIAEEIGIAHYHSMGEHESQKKRVFAEAPQFAVCYQSLKLYEEMGFVPEFDIVIIDEASQVFRAWTDPTQHLASSTMLFNILDKSKNAIILDADIDDELCLWGLSRIANFAPETSALYYNSASYLRDYKVAIEDNYGRTLQKIVNSINAGQRVAVFTSYGDDEGTLSALGLWLEMHCPGKKIKAFDSKTVRKSAPELKTNPNKTISDWIKNDELDCLLVSSWAACGWDYLVKGYDFDEVFVLSTGGFFSAQKIKQMLRRMRMTRKASVYISNPRHAAFKHKTFNAIENEKGIYESEMSRMDAWHVRAKEAHDMDLANVPWLLEELLEDGRALVQKIVSTEEEIESGNAVLVDWKEFKKEAEQEYADRNQSSREQVLRVLSNFKRAAPEGFIDFDEEDISDKEMKALVNRSKRIDSNDAIRLCRLISMDEQEREEEDLRVKWQYNVLLGRLLDALWFELGELVDSESFFSFAHWYSDPESTPIYGDFDTLNLKGLRLNRSNLRALQEELSKSVGNDALTEPNRMLKPLVEAFDLTFTTKSDMDKLPKQERIGAKEGERNLFAYYQQTKEPGFIFKAKVTLKKAWCFTNIKRKQKAHKRLSKPEQDFLMSRPKSFMIKRKTFISYDWLHGMTRAVKAMDDKSGFSQNHTKYCSCGCQEEKRVVLSQ